ncbi:MAG: MFS transporter [Alphaproteobacteria bacterium]|nr:MFS transporter [Alphaproteobacteria bacterium]
MLLAALWVGLYAQWTTVVPTIVPDQVSLLVGQSGKAAVAGLVLGAGAAVALVVAPLAGMLSDRRQSARGRRRPYLVAGMLGSTVALWFAALAGTSGPWPLYLLAVLNLQFWWNWAAGPYAGLVPDIVPAPEQGVASSWTNVMSIVGTIAGNAVMAALYPSPGVFPVVAVLSALGLMGLALTVAGTREPPAAGAPQSGMPRSVRPFWPAPRQHGDFYRVLVTRLAANLGIWSVFEFLLFYLEDVAGIGRPAAPGLLSALLGGGAILAIPASMAGIRFADRFGIVRAVAAMSAVMAAAAAGYVAVAFYPRLWLVVPLVVLFSVGYGAYGAVDWALALRVLPNSRDSGKDMGIWHICMVLPQVVGPAGTGVLISALAAAFSPRLAYTVAFAVAAIWFLVATIVILPMRLAAKTET